MKPDRHDSHEPAYSIGTKHLHWSAIGFGAGFYFVVVLSYLLWRFWLAPESTPNPGIVPPAPRLQAHPGADLMVERAGQEARLDGFAWVDREAGIARIPIERAMQLLVEHPPSHAPSTSAPSPSQPQPQPQPSPQSQPPPRSQSAPAPTGAPR